MRCWIEISGSAIKQNYEIFSRVSQPATLIPIIKSNAYGHGSREIFSILESLNPKWLGVNYLEEAKEIRDWGYQGSILVVGPVPQRKYSEAQSLNADIFIGDQVSLEAWLPMPSKPRAHLKVDTGMSRQGFHISQLTNVLDSLEPFKSEVIGLASHFANVEDVIDLTYAKLQEDRFKKASELCIKKGFQLQTHIASSASTLLMDESHHNLTRVGISLYGLWPSPATRLSFLQSKNKLEDLSPVLSWKTEVALKKQVKEGDFIGYGCTYRALKDMDIAVLPVGYYEGYPRLASDRGSFVLIKGKRCPVVGRICMNMMMIDVSHVPEVETNDVVTLIGTDGEETIDAGTLGDWAETIHYEILTCLNPKIPRRIID